MLASSLVGPNSPLRALRGQRRLLNDKLVVLVPVNGYYAQKECCSALRRLGHHVVEVVLGEQGKSGPTPQNLHKIMAAVVQHRPDMMLSINYSGFDRANYLGQVVEAMGLPTAVWFVDHPIVLAQGWLPVSADCMSLFMWDRSFVPAARALGAQRVFHLPLGTDETLFMPGPVGRGGVQPVGFVGHSLVILENKWRRELTQPEQRRAEQMAQALLKDRSCLHELVPDIGPPIDRTAMVLAFGCVLASKEYRQKLLRGLDQRTLHVTGDPHWAQLLPKAVHHPSTDYGAQSAQVYRDTTISVNATNLQMPSTVNQRLFDVPATGGFLITDHQPEMAELFELGHGKEMMVYQSAEELRDAVRYYAAHPSERQQMAARARARVLGAHTYTHRLQTLLQVMRREHQSLPLGAVAPKGTATATL
jgi:spore maturation protein CgeB